MAAQETLAAEVVGILRADQIPFILVGAAALAVRGLARGTHDIDFMCTERSVLDLRWSERIPGDASVAVFREMQAIRSSARSDSAARVRDPWMSSSRSGNET